MKIQSQNLNGNPTQTTEVVRLTSNFLDHLVLLIKYGLHQKKSHFRTFAPSTPSDIIRLQDLPFIAVLGLFKAIPVPTTAFQ